MCQNLASGMQIFFAYPQFVQGISNFLGFWKKVSIKLGKREDQNYMYRHKY